MDKDFIRKCSESSSSMAEAARKAGMPHMTFKRYAIELGVYSPNQAGKGTKRPLKSLEDILDNKVGMRPTNLKNRLFEEGYKERKCEKCPTGETWENEPLVLELHHKDGNPKNNRLENLQILCPNCHSQTRNFRSRNISKSKNSSLKLLMGM